MKTNLAIEMIPVGDLKPYGKNPRKNDGAVDAVASSIKEFGFKVPLVVTSDGEIVCGHTRFKAAKKLALAELPCVRTDDLTPAQIKAFRLADNKTSELAVWDLGLLEGELKALEFEMPELDLGDFGFPQEVDGYLDEGDTESANAESATGNATPNTAIPREQIQIGRGTLPPELQDLELEPQADAPRSDYADIPDAPLARERVIVTYPRERAADVAAMLGVPEVSKIVWRIEELIPQNDG